MTTKDERTNSILWTEELCKMILKDSRFMSVNPDTEDTYRSYARSILRHLPTKTELELTHEKFPEMWGKP